MKSEKDQPEIICISDNDSDYFDAEIGDEIYDKEFENIPITIISKGNHNNNKSISNTKMLTTTRIMKKTNILIQCS
ncbi:unnamed protein product [Cunninghamella blakesleeana]